MIDVDGFRPNVGIILCNQDGLLFWGRRLGQNAWQFPQGGIQQGETPEQALYRELCEEVGLLPTDVEILGFTKGWLRYRLPPRLVRPRNGPLCICQKQVGYLLRLLNDDQAVRLDACDHPEFDRWRWVDYWYPIRKIVAFKRGVYRRALAELAPVLFPGEAPLAS